MRTYSSEGCADAMCAAAMTAEEANYIDNGILAQQRELIDELADALQRLLSELRVMAHLGLLDVTPSLNSTADAARLVCGKATGEHHAGLTD